MISRGEVGRIARSVARDFRANQGFLLAGAVAYYSLLSLVPLFVVLLVALSHLLDPGRLIATIANNLEILLPGQTAAITDQVTSFLAHRQVVGVVGGVVLLFFSSMAFSVLEGAMTVIFRHRVAHRRHPLISAVLPYLFICSLGFGLLVMTAISATLEAVGRHSITLLGSAWSLAGASGVALHAIGIGGLALVLTAFYAVMPAGPVSLRRALAGGVTATLLWEIVRRALVWYFAHLSMVNVLYGGLATTIVVLLTLEAGAVIILVGAQVIAEIERRDDDGHFASSVELQAVSAP